MPITEAIKLFVEALTGKTPTGMTIYDMIKSGAAIIKEPGTNSVLVKSSTPDSDKVFAITVTDDGTITAVEAN